MEYSYFTDYLTHSIKKLRRFLQTNIAFSRSSRILEPVVEYSITVCLWSIFVKIALITNYVNIGKKKECYLLLSPLEDANQQASSNCELPEHPDHHLNVGLQPLPDQSVFCQQYANHHRSNRNAQTRLGYVG